jgi:hypothetical protein
VKRSAILFLTLLAITFNALAQENNDEHLLDGTSMDYHYQNGSAVHVEFIDGQFHYKWIAGPNKDAEGSEPYRSRKIGDRLYLVNFMVQTNSSFVTIIFNFNQNVIHTSALLAPKSDQEMIMFHGGIIEHLNLKEN